MTRPIITIKPSMDLQGIQQWIAAEMSRRIGNEVSKKFVEPRKPQ